MGRVLTDIHAHILPGVDDGPTSMEDSVALLDEMKASGVSRAFCTSHFRSPHFDTSIDLFKAAYDSLAGGRATGLGPELALGAEVRLNTRFEQDLKAGLIPTLGDTSYVLVEFDTPEISKLAFQLVYELRIRGYRPIMAHPERNLAVQHDERLVEQLREEGVLMQATAQCFTVPNASEHRSFKLAWTLLEQGKIDLIASDTHNVTTRPPNLSVAYERIEDRLGHDTVDILIGNANAVWENEACARVPEVVQARGGLRRLFSRGR